MFPLHSLVPLWRAMNFRMGLTGSLLLLSITFQLLAQTPKQPHVTFERITTDLIRYEKGLSQNTVQAIMQDRFGFLWFGTWDGLNKYDGYTFSIWNEENGLSNQNIQALVEDLDGKIWIGTEDGLNVYDRSKDEITRFRNDHRNINSLVHNRIRTLCLDHQGNVWIGTNRGISVYDRELKQFVNYKHDVNDRNSLIHNWINQIFCDSAGRIWIATFRGIDTFDPVTKRFTHLSQNSGWDALLASPTYCFAQDPDHRMVVSNQNGLFRIDFPGKRADRIPVATPSTMVSPVLTIYHLLFDKNGLLWIGTARDGAWTFNPADGTTVFLQNQKDNPQSISNDQIVSLFMDNAGIVWIGTYFGLNKYDQHSSKFRHHRQNPNDPQSLLSDVIFSFFEDDDGTIWVGSERGINLFQPDKGSFRVLSTSNGNPAPLISGLVRCFHKDREGLMWIGSMGGLMKYNPDTRQSERFVADPHTPKTLSSNYVWKIAEDNHGYLWIATDKGLNRFDRKTKVFTGFFFEENDPFSLPDNNVYDVYTDLSGRVWAATGAGLCRFDEKRQGFIRVMEGGVGKLTANQRRTASIFEASDGVFWIGTFGGGLLRYHPQKGSFRYFTEKEGLPNNVVYKVIDDQKGSLWVSTNRGIARFSIINESFSTYGLKDGIQSNEFNLNAALRTRNGRILFGGMNGFNSFFPDEIRKNEKPARIAISGFFVFDKLIRRELFDGDTIRLKYSENFFAIVFTALDFANPAKNQYKYYLQNFEKGWVTTDAYDRLAEYTNVPPGKYLFRVKGSNNDGIWNNEGISITLIISPPWYATWGFRGGAIGAVCLLIYIMVMSRIGRINRKHRIEKQFLEMERQYADLEQKALRLQMNPHFIFNTLNSIQSYMISNEADTAIEYLAKFARLMRQVLTNSRESFIPVREEIVALRYYLEIEQLRFDDKFEFTISIDDTIDEDFTGIPPMIIQPYVENAIIHGLMYKKGRGTIAIRLEQRSTHLFCIIEDDGVGREKAMQMAKESGLERKSSGMMITQQRLDILNKNDEKELKVNVVDKVDEQGIACGTRVEIKMPVVEI
jgi:ligand-binding sensor domain-containing protein/two-component sensor histidine kinase